MIPGLSQNDPRASQDPRLGSKGETRSGAKRPGRSKSEDLYNGITVFVCLCLLEMVSKLSQNGPRTSQPGRLKSEPLCSGIPVFINPRLGSKGDTRSGAKLPGRSKSEDLCNGITVFVCLCLLKMVSKWSQSGQKLGGVTGSRRFFDEGVPQAEGVN